MTIYLLYDQLLSHNVKQKCVCPVPSGFVTCSIAIYVGSISGHSCVTHSYSIAENNMRLSSLCRNNKTSKRSVTVFRKHLWTNDSAFIDTPLLLHSLSAFMNDSSHFLLFLPAEHETHADIVEPNDCIHICSCRLKMTVQTLIRGLQLMALEPDVAVGLEMQKDWSIL